MLKILAFVSIKLIEWTIIPLTIKQIKQTINIETKNNPETLVYHICLAEFKWKYRTNKLSVVCTVCENYTITQMNINL